MAQIPIVPPYGECFTEFGDTNNLAAIAQATSELAFGSSSGATPGQFTSAPQLVTVSGSIPAGVKSWAFAAVSGSVTLNGSALANGTTVSGGGYSGQTLANAIPYTISGGSAFLTTDT
jgi:hypothetical protein